MAVEQVPAAVEFGRGSDVPFEQLYREHFGFVFSSLLRLGVPSAAVDDATQDVFITVHRQLPGFEGRSSLRSWLFGIARRVAFRHRRSAQRLAHKAQALAAVPPPTPQSPAESLELAQRGRMLLRALDSLDEDKRAALTLHAFEELPGPELAEILGVNIDTAYSRIKAARRELQRSLVALGATDEPDALIAATRHATRPDPAARQRVAGLLAVRLGTGAGELAVTTGAAATFAGAKGTLAAVAVGAAIAIGVGLGDGGRDTPRAAVSRAVELEPVQAPAVVASRPLPAELAPTRAATPVSSAPASTAGDPASSGNAGRIASSPEPRNDDALAAALTEEVALITAAKKALDDGAPERALTQLDAHAARFAEGQLASERAGYRAIALCMSGQLVAGRGQGKAFLAHARSVTLAARVRDTCGFADDVEKISPPR